MVEDAIADRVYSRAPGQITKEIGQAQACLETYCENIGESASDLAELEWQRVRQIPRDEWQRRHTAKQAIGIAITDKRPPLMQEEWPLGCHDPDSCHRHQDCMYANCRWKDKEIAFTSPSMQEDGK